MSGENTPMSKKGKFSVQNWQSDPMNSPKAFGKLNTELTVLNIAYLYNFMAKEEENKAILAHWRRRLMSTASGGWWWRSPELL